ncbi:MAG: lamin tail domain-containing protein, partial [Actinomycetota bacterium]
MAISLIGGFALPAAAVGDDGPVVISEIMYNPAEDPTDDDVDDIDNNEYVELHNVSATAVDLTGYSWGDGVDGTLDGVVIPVGGFVVVSPDAVATSATYGVAAAALYTGKLKNGGESLALLGPDGEVVDQVDFDDVAPWPIAADGEGPSIELIDPSGPNDEATAWQASTSGGTPGRGPSVVAPTIGEVTMTPEAPGAGASVTVSAAIGGASAAVLTYRVGFDVEVEVTMARDGDRFSATIPGQRAGSLVRYRIRSGNGLTHPESDARPFAGYVVAGGHGDSGVPLLRFFMADADHDRMLGSSRFDRDRLFPAVIVYDGEVFDGAAMQVRGGDYARINHDKLSLNVELPDGYVLDAPDLFPQPVDEFALQAEVSDPSMARAHASWDIYEREGFHPVASNFVQVTRNGSFYGLFRMSEKLDGVWRDANGFGDGDFYKADGGWRQRAGFDPTGFDQKEGDPDSTIIVDTRALITQPSSAAKTAALYDHFDVPNIVNYIAVSTVVQHIDQGPHNYYVSHDAGDTGRVGLHPWDLDLSWGLGVASRCSEPVMTDLDCLNDPLFDSFAAVPELDAAVNRRIRSILDHSVAEGRVQQRHDELIETVGPELEQLEADTWDRRTMTQFQNWFNGNVDNVYTTLDRAAGVPPSPSEPPSVVIAELAYDPADDGAEFVELVNTGGASVDLSGWEVDGVGLDVPFGTVLASGGRLVLTDDDRAFRSRYPGLGVIVVQYPGGLKNSGETITVLDRDGAVVDEVSYSSEGLWPVAPADGEATLELVDLSADNDDPTVWQASGDADGTPGRPNEAVGAPADPGVSDPGGVPSDPGGVPSVPGGVPSVPGVSVPGGVVVVVRALGSTGDEVLSVGHGDRVFGSVGVSRVFGEYEFVVPVGVSGLQVGFVNDGLSGGVDRNLR